MNDFTPFGDEPQGTLRYLQALRARWVVIVVIVVAAVGSAAAYSLAAPKRYKAAADVLVTPVQGDDLRGFSVLRDTGEGTRTVLTAARFLTTPEVADAAAEQLQIGLSGRKLLEKIEVKPVSQSNIVAIEAEASTPEGAAAIANAFAEALVATRTRQFQTELEDAIRRLEAQVDGLPVGATTTGEGLALEQRLADLRSFVGAPDPTLQLVSRAVPPTKPSWPRPVLSIVVALFASLLLGSGVAIALELVGPRITREDELLLRQRLPILARVPRLRDRNVKQYLADHGAMPPAAWEAYRTLRAALAVAGPRGGYPETVLITSAIPGEGKTMTSVNLAVTMAVAGHSVILVDGDLRRPMVATVFGVAARRHGFASLLLGRASTDDVLVSAPGYGDRLRILVAGPEQSRLVDVLEPSRVESALAQLKQSADIVIVDSPPLTEVADALALADAVDAVIVSVRLGYSRRNKLTELRRMLAQQGISPVGFVVTTRDRPSRDGYHYHSPESTDVFRARGSVPAGNADRERTAPPARS